MTTSFEARSAAPLDDPMGFLGMWHHLPLGVGLCLGARHLVQFVNPALDAFWVGRDPVGKVLSDAYPALAARGHTLLWDRAFSSGEPVLAPEVFVDVARHDATEESCFHLT